MDGLLKIRIMFIITYFIYTSICGLSVFLSRKKLNSYNINPLFVFILLVFFNFSTRLYIGQPETLALCTSYLYLGMVFSNNKYLEYFSGILTVLFITSLKGITGWIFIPLGFIILLAYYYKVISLDTLKRVLISGIIGVLLTVAFYFLIYPTEIAALKIGAKRYVENSIGVKGYIKRLLKGISVDFLVGLYFGLYALVIYFLKIRSKNTFIKVHMLFCILSIPVMLLFHKYFLVFPKVPVYVGLPYSFSIFVMAILLSGFFFYDKKYIGFIAFLIIWSLTKCYFYIQGFKFEYHLSLQVLALLFLILTSVPIVINFYKSQHIIIVTMTYILILSVMLLFTLFAPYHLNEMKNKIDNIDDLVKKVKAEFPELLQQQKILAISGIGENFFLGIPNHLTFNQYHYDLSVCANYSSDPFWEPYKKQLLDYTGDYIVFLFFRPNILRKQGDQKIEVPITPKEYYNSVFHDRVEEATEFLIKYQQMAHYSKDDINIFIIKKIKD
ncbi:MAG: hypothetical protein ACRCTQ_05635 [Brevinemataceae bacterium]